MEPIAKATTAEPALEVQAVQAPAEGDEVVQRPHASLHFSLILMRSCTGVIRCRFGGSTETAARQSSGS